jgi:hypothetical protein
MDLEHNKILRSTFLWAAVFCWLVQAFSAHCEGTAFTYQGKLTDTNSPACGSYDFTFSLYSSNTLASPQIGQTLTNVAVLSQMAIFQLFWISDRCLTASRHGFL